jgi:hypothetical protein
VHLTYLFLYFWRHGCAFHIHFLMTQHLLDINPYLQHLLSLIQRECSLKWEFLILVLLWIHEFWGMSQLLVVTWFVYVQCRLLRKHEYDTVTVKGWAYKVTLALRPFLICCASPWVLIIPDSSTRALWQLPTDTSSNKAGETWREMASEFWLWSIYFILTGFFDML